MKKPKNENTQAKVGLAASPCSAKFSSVSDSGQGLLINGKLIPYEVGVLMAMDILRISLQKVALGNVNFRSADKLSYDFPDLESHSLKSSRSQYGKDQAVKVASGNKSRNEHQALDDGSCDKCS